ncbi:ATP-binding protein [Oerskovia jenensis]
MDASPTKAFFVRMLTRDITLDDCILDLVDNSIDSAWKSIGAQPTVFTNGDLLSKFEISIEFSDDHFKISDNCGGISIENAISYAFTFGRKEPEDAPPHEAARQRIDGDYSVGVYGIGMKRAIFKIGDSVKITSTHDRDGTVSSFSVPIVVSEWLAERATPWDFEMDAADHLKEPGVEIEIHGLNDDAARRFRDPLYQRSLIEEVLGRDYLIPLMQGLVIKVNGVKVPFKPLKLLTSDTFVPLRESFHDGDVTVEIIAGMHAAPPDSNEPEVGRPDRESGWYIVCNGRVVLAADRTHLTGWGVKEFPRWHGQYSGFVGMVLFAAADPSLLPMTTTKRSVDPSLAVYQRTVNRMLKPARAWIDYTNARKSALDDARKLEESASTVEASTVLPSSKVGLPAVRASRAQVANVNYAVPKNRMVALARALGNVNMSYRDVGQESFNYTYEAHVDADE